MASDPDLSGQQLGRYRLVRRIGSGGMGIVYEATHIQLGTRTAIKVLRKQHARRPVLRERFIREAQASATINHPNIVAIHDFGETSEGWPYYVMEYLEGGDFRSYLRTMGPWTWPQLEPLMVQALRALAAAHQRGVIHRDIKPANCFVVGDVQIPHDCELKLLDFGIARLLREGQPRLTLDGQVLGTPAYMAPEVALGGPADARSDVYSLAVTIHKMLTGRLPGKGRPQPPHGIPEHLLAVLGRALARDPNERFPGMESFAAALFGREGRFASPGPRNRPPPEQRLMSLRQATPKRPSSTAPGQARPEHLSATTMPVDRSSHLPARPPKWVPRSLLVALGILALAAATMLALWLTLRGA